MSKIAFEVLHFIENETVIEKSGSLNVFGTTYNTHISAGLAETQTPNSELVTPGHAGHILLSVLLAVEAAFMGDAALSLSLPVKAPTDTSPAEYYNLSLSVNRL